MQAVQFGAKAAAALALLAAYGCGDEPAGAGGQTGTGGSATSGGPVTTTGSKATSTGATTATTGVGGSSYVCDPPAEPGSLYELYAESLDVMKLEPVSMCEYRGDVLLIVNAAANCGYTPQTAALQVLEETFSASGFHVLGFYSDDFGMQGGDPDDIDNCTDQYMVTYEQFVKGPVTLPAAQPVWAWLLSQPNPVPSVPLAPDWNFHKYLISKDGQLVGHWVTSFYPGDDPNNPNDSFAGNELVQAIQQELAQ